jgi:hypothetical protein
MEPRASAPYSLYTVDWIFLHCAGALLQPSAAVALARVVPSVHPAWVVAAIAGVDPRHLI